MSITSNISIHWGCTIDASHQDHADGRSVGVVHLHDQEHGRRHMSDSRVDVYFRNVAEIEDFCTEFRSAALAGMANTPWPEPEPIVQCANCYCDATHRQDAGDETPVCEHHWMHPHPNWITYNDCPNCQTHDEFGYDEDRSLG